MRARTFIAAWVLMVPLLALPAGAQEAATSSPPTSLTVTTPYPGVAAEAGDQISFGLAVSAPRTTSVSLEAEAVPDGWTTAFHGGGFTVDAIIAGPDLQPDVTFDVTLPVDAPEGEHEMTVVARAGSDTVRLPITVRVSAQAGGEVTLTPDFPGLRSPAGEEVTFNVTLRNTTPTDLDFELDSSAPTGWTISAEPADESQATTLAVKANSTETIRVKTESPGLADAGQYPITVKATAGDTSVEASMIVEIVGSYSVDLTTADQRLNAEVSVGGSNELPLVVTNTGTAPLEGARISSTPPRGWEVTFDTEDLAPIPPGESTVITATLTPAENAVAGDYSLTFRVSADQASDSIEVRTTVNPSALWGFVGVGLIALTLAGLGVVFRRFGRR